jgi:phage tail-like protein
MPVAKPPPLHDPMPPVYSAAHFAIEIDDISPKGQLPTLRAVDGGGVKADVVNYQMGENGDVWRQLGKPKYDDIKLTLGLADADGFFGWIKRTLAGEHLRKNGAIIAADSNYCERARREFTEAILIEFGCPKWDANDKNQANCTITMAPEKVVFKPGNGKAGPILDHRANSDALQKQITACNFEFSIDGFVDACKRVAKVDALSIKVKTVEYHYGTRLESAKMPGKIEYPNLVFYVPEADAEPFRVLHNERMAGIRKDNGKGLGAQLTFYNNKRVNKGQFEFKGVHIFNVSSEKADASAEEMKLTKIEAAVEHIDFKLL